MNIYLDDDEFEQQLEIFKMIEEQNIIKNEKEKEEEEEEKKKEELRKKREELRKKILDEKIKTYPHIPENFTLQKQILGINNREKEINTIDMIIKLDIKLKKFIFNGLKQSYNEVCDDFIDIFYLFKYQTQYPAYNALRFKLKYGYKSSIFKHFLFKYFNTMKKKGLYAQNVNFPLILISSPIFFSSLNFLCELSKNIIGIDNIWKRIDSFL